MSPGEGSLPEAGTREGVQLLSPADENLAQPRTVPWIQLGFTSTSVSEFVCRWCEIAWLTLHSWWLKHERSKKNLGERKCKAGLKKWVGAQIWGDLRQALRSPWWNQLCAQEEESPLLDINVTFGL